MGGMERMREFEEVQRMGGETLQWIEGKNRKGREGREGGKKNGTRIT